MSASSVDIPTDYAQWLFENGATLVFLDLPTGSEFGIDYNCYEVGPQFKGVKMIPPGTHFIYYSATSSDKHVALRTGFMHTFTRKEVVIKVWDPAAEDIKDDAIDGDLRERIVSNKQELDRFLGVYPYDSYKKWVSLTDHITPLLLEQVLPLNGKIWSATPLVSEGSTTESRRAAAAMSVEPETSKSESRRVLSRGGTDDDDPRLPHMSPVPGSQIRFTNVAVRNVAPSGSTASEITRLGMDHTDLLKSVIESYPSQLSIEQGVLGELQFAFVCFLIGQVFEAFDAWKRNVHLLCCCVEAISEYPSLYLHLLSVLHRHITEVPSDFFVDITTRDNFLVGALRLLFENIEACVDNASTVDVKRRARLFRDHLELKFNWDFGAECGEFAPVVVVD